MSNLKGGIFYRVQYLSRMVKLLQEKLKYIKEKNVISDLINFSKINVHTKNSGKICLEL